ncbi:FHA domain-containing protein [Quadrisphaera oryzae]|uniref:FHA domain-containing protein n=1 Tax=Quadrisphaera TaxID=317661 RepID=UPI0016479649|nr:FHA domain-containing protein [Quadrisphaera sp. RL12-1S]MBC3764168.1 FHA domain-containing protein [Quadrisphaera sp. RL12-1S]
MTPTYRCGAWLVVLDGQTLVAVLPTAELAARELLDRLWPAVVSGADLTGLLEALLADGWARAPHFVVLERREDQQVTVVVRGPARVSATAAGHAVELTGDGVLTWAEQRVDAVHEVHLPTQGEALDGPSLPLRSGAVMASTVRWAAQVGHGAPDEPAHDDVDAAPPLAPPPALAEPARTAPVSLPQDQEQGQAAAPGPWDHLFEPTDHRTLPPPADEAAADPAAGPGSGSDPDHDQMTVTAAGVAALHQRLGAAAMAEQETQGTMPPVRPWVLRLSDGQEVAVRGRVLVGREPRADRVPGTDVPHLVPVDSPTGDVSRTHVELRVDERGALLARDLHSTNGTFVLVGQAPPTALPAGTSAVVPVGAVLDIGDGVTITAVQEDL